MIPLAIIRPEPGCTASVSAARAMGLEAHGHPLFAVSPVAWELPDLAAFDGLLIGSANVLRHGGAHLAALRHLQVHAVGETTARAAEAAGFTVAATGAGGLQPVLDAVAPGTRLLRLAGAERIALTPPAGVTMAERVVYASAPLAMPAALAALFAVPAVVALHSAEAARHLAAECDRLGLARAALSLAVIGPRVSAAAGEGWARVALAGTASEAALLSCAADLCQNPAFGK
jgi:uroporphyrinogen-III synthase